MSTIRKKTKATNNNVLHVIRSPLVYHHPLTPTNIFGVCYACLVSASRTIELTRTKTATKKYINFFFLFPACVMPCAAEWATSRQTNRNERRKKIYIELKYPIYKIVFQIIFFVSRSLWQAGVLCRAWDFSVLPRFLCLSRATFIHMLYRWLKKNAV